MTIDTDHMDTQRNRAPDPLLLNVAEAGSLLGVSKWTIYELMNGGALPSIKIQSRRFIAKADLLIYVARLREEAGERHGL